MNWQMIKADPSTADENMRRDVELLKNLKTEPKPVLHFYDWNSDAATYGYFINPFDHLSPAGVQKRKLQLARRPTGGGVIFHLWDFAFSLLLPSSHPAVARNTLQNYATVNACVISVIGRFLGKQASLFQKETISEERISRINRGNCCRTNTFCMTNPTQYDVILEGKKVGGAAQRRTKWGLLHQGSLSLLTPSIEYLKDLLPVETAIQMEHMSYPLLKSPADLANARKELKHLFTNQVKEI